MEWKSLQPQLPNAHTPFSSIPKPPSLPPAPPLSPSYPSNPMYGLLSSTPSRQACKTVQTHPWTIWKRCKTNPSDWISISWFLSRSLIHEVGLMKKADITSHHIWAAVLIHRFHLTFFYHTESDLKRCIFNVNSANQVGFRKNPWDPTLSTDSPMTSQWMHDEASHSYAIASSDQNYVFIKINVIVDIIVISRYDVIGCKYHKQWAGSLLIYQRAEHSEFTLWAERQLFNFVLHFPIRDSLINIIIFFCQCHDQSEFDLGKRQQLILVMAINAVNAAKQCFHNFPDFVYLNFWQSMLLTPKSYFQHFRIWFDLLRVITDY